MKRLTFSYQTLGAVGLVLLFSTLADAQMVRPRKPSEPVTQPVEEPYKPLPTPAEREAMVESEIRDVRVVPSTQNVTISFRAFPNTVPLVELAKVQPKVGADGRWGFAPGSGSVTRPAGGDKANGEYTVDMNQELEPDATYYYIISARSDDGTRDQVTGKLSQSGSFVVRYRGFISQEKTSGPGSDEIYAIVSASFADPRGRPSTVTETHPHVIVEDVESGDVHGDPGRTVYQGGAQNLVLAVTLMEHDRGQSYEYRDVVNGAVVGAYGVLTLSHPPLLIGDLVSGAELAGAMLDISTAVQQALEPGDDVIGTTTRLITAEEMRSIANQPSSDEQGITYNFFTEHRGHGGIYRVYFDIVLEP